MILASEHFYLPPFLYLHITQRRPGFFRLYKVKGRHIADRFFVSPYNNYTIFFYIIQYSENFHKCATRREPVVKGNDNYSHAAGPVKRPV